MKKLIRAMIVDDDVASRTILSKFLEVDNNVNIVGSVGKAREAMKLFQQLLPDVIFLDISMPEEDGIHFASRLREINALVPIVFTTAYPYFAAMVYELNPLDYLVKPFGVDRVFEVLTKIEHKLSEHELHGTKLWGGVIPDRLKLKTTRGYIFAELNDILYFSVYGSIARVHFTNGSDTRIAYTLKDLYQEIEHLNFMKINRSQIINLTMLDRVESCSESCILRFGENEYRLSLTRSAMKYFESLQSLRLG